MQAAKFQKVKSSFREQMNENFFSKAQNSEGDIEILTGGNHEDCLAAEEMIPVETTQEDLRLNTYDGKKKTKEEIKLSSNIKVTSTRRTPSKNNYIDSDVKFDNSPEFQNSPE